MNYYYKSIVLWLKNGKQRTLSFEPGKVNVITGGSNTGKSTILEIIDYCLFASTAKIAESVINENVTWYGLVITINDKEYTICRTALKDGKVTNNYYFSSTGDIPEEPIVNCDVTTIKPLIEAEFSIDSKVVVPFGGSHLRAGSKFSLRYFLLFTTISQDIITNSSVFFDKQNVARYREALERIFDIAIGVDTIENIIARERKLALEANLLKCERRKELFNEKQSVFKKELNDLIRRSKEYNLIASDLDLNSSLKALDEVIANKVEVIDDVQADAYEELAKSKNIAQLTIRNLERLQLGYRKYKESLKNTRDSLKPLEYIRNKKSELVRTSIFAELIDTLEKDLLNIKEDVKARTAIDRNIADLIAEEKLKIKRIQEKLDILPENLTAFNSDREKHFFIGKLAAKLDLYGESSPTNSLKVRIEGEIKQLKDSLSQLSYNDVSEQREITISLLEEFAQKYIKLAGEALGNYKDFHPRFENKDKTFSFRRPYSEVIETVGSSSNHMFLHIILFLALHEVIIAKRVPFVPSYLVIDQPSRPYWGEKGKEKESLDTGDEFKVQKVFELLNEFMKAILSIKNTTFQMIVFEHVPSSYWKDLEHIHLAEEFVGSNALIRDSDLDVQREDKSDPA